MQSIRQFLSLLILSSTLVHAQSDTAKVERWRVGLHTGAGVGYRTLSQTGSDPLYDNIIRSRNDREEPRVAYAAGAVVEYRVSRKVGLEAGFGYSQLGWLYRVDFSQLTFGDLIDPRRGFIYQTDDAIPNKYVHHEIFHYAEFRIGATLSLGKGRWRSVSSLGVAPSFLIEAKYRTISEYADGRTERESKLSPYTYGHFNLFPYFGTGVEYRSGERWEWQLLPTVRYGVFKIIDSPITAHLFMGTVDVGVRFTL